MDGDGAEPVGDIPGGEARGRWHAAVQITPSRVPARRPPAQPVPAAPRRPNTSGFVDPARPAPEPARVVPEPTPVAVPTPPPVAAAPIPPALEATPAPPPFVPAAPPLPAPTPPVAPTADAAAPSDRSSRRLLWIVGAIAAAVVLVGVGILIGLALRRNAVDDARAQTRAAHATARAQSERASSLRNDLRARDAQIAALEAAARATTVPTTVPATVPTTVPSSTPTTQPATATPTSTTLVLVPTDGFADGLYEVGADIQPGQYRTDGGPNCYWAKLQTDDTTKVLVNNLTAGPQTVTIDSPFFVSSGCGTWTKVA